MKNSIKCPVCGRDFDPRTPVCHISKYHQAAKNCEPGEDTRCQTAAFQPAPQGLTVNKQTGEIMTGEKELSFENAVKPLIKWLNDNENPHAVVIVEVDKAVLYSGKQSTVTDEFIRD